MSFGISSVPEVFQQRMHKLDITGTETVADHFMVAGFGATYGEALCDQNRNCCHSPAVFMAWGKACTGKTSTALRRLYGTKTGLKVHPDKVMPRLTVSLL